MLTASSATVFRLEPGLRVLNVSACVILAGMGVLMGVMGVDYGTPWVVAAAGAIVLGSAWLLVRAARVRVSFDADTLVILGFFRTHRIARTAVLEVDHYSLDRPTVRWAPPGESDRWAVLSPLALSSNALVRSLGGRRQEVLPRQRGDVEPCCLSATHPPQFLDLSRGRGHLITELELEHVRDDEEARLVGRVRGEGAQRSKLVGRGRKAELLVQLAAERLGRGLVGLRLSARLHEGRRTHLPHQQQLVALVDDHGSRHANAAGTEAGPV